VIMESTNSRDQIGDDYFRVNYIHMFSIN